MARVALVLTVCSALCRGLYCAAAPSAAVDVSSSPWLANAGPIPDAPTGHDAWDEVSYGAALFTHGKVSASITAFDTAISLDDRTKGMLWQRGLSLFYTSSWLDGASQFSYDVALNPHDTEESIWRWLCQARTLGVKKATANMLVTTGETRPYMKVIYAMFRSGTASAKQQVLDICGAGLNGDSEPPPQAGQVIQCNQHNAQHCMYISPRDAAYLHSCTLTRA